MKCIWCSKPCEAKITVEDRDGTYACCSEECKRQTEKFLCSIKRFTPFFLGLIGICVVALLATSVTIPRYGGLCLAGMGAVILFLPFCTPQTVQALGLRKSVRIGRVTGILIIALGIFLFFWI
jgi:hypothetical protein